MGMLTATSNEHVSKLNRVRDRVPDLKVAAKPLLAGDYMFEAHGKLVAIEAKWSLSDLYDSFRVEGESGGPRLAVETRKLSSVADIAFLVCPPIQSRGDGKALRDDGQVSGWEYNSVKGILTDVQLAGVFVDEWDGDIAQRIAQLYYVLSHQEHDWIKQRGRPEFVTLDPRYRATIWALCAFDMVGPVTAAALLEGRSVMDVGRLTLKELLGIEHVGPKVAKSLQEGLNKQW